MKGVAKIASYPFSVIFYLFFLITLVIFDIIQRICYYTMGYKAHKISVDVVNFILVYLGRFVFTRYTIIDEANVPKNNPVLIISNHQSMFDIPSQIWFLRRFHPKFVSKKSLGKGIPTISFNLKKGGSVLIDRKDKEDSLKKLKEFAHYLKENNRAGVLFPEGTRSKDGNMGIFKKGGITMLIEELKGGYIIPVSISNSWKLQRYGTFPIPLGVHFKMKVHPGILIEDQDVDALIDQVEDIVRSGISQD